MSTNIASIKYAELNQPKYTSFGSRVDGDTMKELGNAFKANTEIGYVEGADFGFGTHGYIDGRKQTILNNGQVISEGQHLNLFG